MAKKIKAAKAEFEMNNSRLPTKYELIEILEITEDELELAENAFNEVISMQKVVFSQGDNDKITVMEQLEDSTNNNWLDHLALKEVIAALPIRDKLIITRRYYEDKTQLEVAEELGISQVQVSRLEKIILTVIRKQLSDTDIPIKKIDEVPTEKYVIKLDEIRAKRTKKKEKRSIKPMEEKQTKKQLIFSLIAKGYSKKRVMSEGGITSQSYYNYVSMHNKEKRIATAEKKEKVMGEIAKKKTESAPENTKYLVVDIVLNDGTVIENCSIFPPDPVNGTPSINDEKTIHDLFRKVPWGRKAIFFQNSCLNASAFVSNVKQYEIKFVDYEEGGGK
jgi:RNA polymerase sigma factor (sigma-70 family)